MFSAVHTPASLRRRLKFHFPQPRMEVRALYPTTDTSTYVCTSYGWRGRVR